MERSPAFQFYPSDFLADPKVAAMSLQERGAYITLLCLCWQDGSLPNEPEKLARMIGQPLPVFRKLWAGVGPCFTEHEGQLIQKRLEVERRKQVEFKRRQSDRGKAGADARWRKDESSDGASIAQASRDDSGAATDAPMLADGSSVFSLQTSVKSQTPSVSASVAPPPLTSELGERVRAFTEGYHALYAQHRHGATYYARPALDYQTACELCTAWPDVERLLKLATVFLTSDDEWIAKGTRSIQQFASRASWCDERLRAWEQARGVA